MAGYSILGFISCGGYCWLSKVLMSHQTHYSSYRGQVYDAVLLEILLERRVLIATWNSKGCNEKSSYGYVRWLQQMRITFSRNVFWGATRPRLDGIAAAVSITSSASFHLCIAINHATNHTNTFNNVYTQFHHFTTRIIDKSVDLSAVAIVNTRSSRLR